MVERYARISSSLRDTLAVLNSNRELEEILEFIVSQAKDLMEADAVAIYTPAIQKDMLHIEASLGLPDEYIQTAVIPMGMLATGYATQIHKPVFLTDITLPSEKEKLFMDAERALVMQKFSQHFRALLAVPLIFSKGEIYGTLDLYYNEPRNFMEEEIDLAKAYADQTILAIDNARLRARIKKAAVMAERDRLARDLHDTVTQELFSLSLVADVLPTLWKDNPVTAELALDEIKQLSKGALAEMRSLLLELRPTALLNTDLDQLIRQLCDSFEGRTRIRVHFDSQPINCIIPADSKMAFYRIIQETLNNTQKHAHATEVSISLSMIDSSSTPFHNREDKDPSQCGHIRIIIQDNGVGFNKDDVSPEHFGLKIIQERADSINADLIYDSKPGLGTRVEIIW
jgi:two-component system nitrate/nitrite sensor histidine kinase NarX